MIAELAPMIDGKPDFTKLKEIHLDELARRFRMQRIVFETASEVYDLMAPTWKGTREYLLAQLVRLVERYIDAGRVVVDPPLFNEDDKRRRMIPTTSPPPRLVAFAVPVVAGRVRIDLGVTELSGRVKKGKWSRLRLVADGRLQRERLPKDVQTTLFRVVQEGLAKVRLHSGSQTAEVKLRRVNDPHEIVLQVKDSGRGMPARVMRAIRAGQMASGLGIPGMMERTRQLGGQLIVETSKRGTVLTARVPLPQKWKSALSAASKCPHLTLNAVGAAVHGSRRTK